MIRGRNHFSLAVRRLDGSIERRCEPLNSLYTGRLGRFPLIRGFLALVETLILGIKALHLSANMAVQDQAEDSGGEIPGWMLGATLAFAMVAGIGIFFLLPLMVVWAIESSIPSGLVSELIEGGIRLVLLIGYIWGISFLRDIKRVFAYHGAEHMAVHAYEAGLPLDVANVRKFPTPHPRCGTAFLLTVMLVSIVVFALLMAPSMEWRILSRIVLIPLIAAVSYEIIRFSGRHQNSLIGNILARPGLLLQRLTTRTPDDAQIEVAISAMEGALAADQGRQFSVSFETRKIETSDGQVSAAAINPEPQTADE
ncbi:MAG: DUF1385 domain-containing protein [Chloroflexi bacterium]|nr:DUF1385 domain-containing protein [Chloroflexota bacterium]